MTSANALVTTREPVNSPNPSKLDPNFPKFPELFPTSLYKNLASQLKTQRTKAKRAVTEWNLVDLQHVPALLFYLPRVCGLAYRAVVNSSGNFGKLGSSLEGLQVFTGSLVVTSAFAGVKLVYETSRTARAPSGIVPNAFRGID